MYEQPSMSVYTIDYLNLIENDFNPASDNINEQVLRVLNDRADDMLVASNILTDPANTVMISEDALTALGFIKRQILLGPGDLKWCWVKNEVSLFPFLEGWKVATGIPAVLDDTTLESLVDLNQYYFTKRGENIITKP
jgi:hypothetical protein